MTYTKAILEVELFDVEDVITTSGASAATGAGVDAGALPVPDPEPGYQPQPEDLPEPDLNNWEEEDV